MDIVLSTRNLAKAAQIKQIFFGCPVNVLTLDDANVQGEAVEDGLTLEENALKKALYALKRIDIGTWTMAEDTGLFIDALGGEPGILAARWAGPGANAQQIVAHTLRRLENVTDRRATFRTAVAVIGADAKPWFFLGEASGKILEVPRVPPPPSMPYSGIFLPDGEDRVWAEMSFQEQNRLSHRGKAFAKARDFVMSRAFPSKSPY
jgi:XTP/dITP diphosphohydrolase